MKLIADSGSTKTDWRFIDSTGKIHQYKSEGLNPYFKTKEECAEVYRTALLNQHEDLTKDSKVEISFYGAGCSCLDKVTQMEEGFKMVFPDADVIVEHDMLAAARALCGKEPGIAAILGTGSNTCYYDGAQIIRNVPALGYILGDEGSGAYIGKQLIQDFCNEELPESVKMRFDKKFNYSITNIFDEVYKGATPNRFLASFAKWIYQISDKEEYAFNLIKKSLGDFLNQHVLKYEQAKNVPLHVVGSVGYYNGNILRKLCDEKGIQLGRVIETPIAGLVLFHGEGED